MNEPKQAKIVKLNHSKQNFSSDLVIMSTPINSTASIKTLTRSNSFETESNHYSEIDELEQNQDVSGESLTKLWVIKDYKRGELVYGDISVKKGQIIYLICESDYYYFIETDQGKQGFVPKEVCVNLEEMTRQMHLQETVTKITSL